MDWWSLLFGSYTFPTWAIGLNWAVSVFFCWKAIRYRRRYHAALAAGASMMASLGTAISVLEEESLTDRWRERNAAVSRLEFGTENESED